METISPPMKLFFMLVDNEKVSAPKTNGALEALYQKSSSLTSLVSQFRKALARLMARAFTTTGFPYCLEVGQRDWICRSRPWLQIPPFCYYLPCLCFDSILIFRGVNGSRSNSGKQQFNCLQSFVVDLEYFSYQQFVNGQSLNIHGKIYA